MALRERNVLQQIVNLIEETGHFNVTNTTFDFDLFSLDETTVRKLQSHIRAPPAFLSLNSPARSTALVTALSSAHKASCTFLVGSRPALPTSSPGAMGLRGARSALLLLLPVAQGPSPGSPLESGLCWRQHWASFL
ncbi:MLLT1 super elongation complex subunit [Phyllostomus discolor]|uniref:MLLT1 super elongation complex subunit n=1 Tax=Phyllostomus discolor TaxID=89673 RepID=A0A834DZ45_9CHIR|nr:MLLT1 super elongation complex subunit [Phyllostomus discolor]